MNRKVRIFRFIDFNFIDHLFSAAKARGTHIRIHFKHAREIGNAIKGLALPRAKAYLENVLEYKEAIPITRYTGGIGRHSQGKIYKASGDKVGWPQKATKTFLDLLVNCASNAEVIFISKSCLYVLKYIYL